MRSKILEINKMRYLLILLFLFSSHSFSGELDGKGLDCNMRLVEQYQKKVSGDAPNRWMYWFNLNTVENVNVRMLSANLFNVRPETPDDMNPAYNKLFIFENEIMWTVGYSTKEIQSNINRKTLDLITKSFDGEGRVTYVYKGRCKVFTGFEPVKKYIAQEKARIKKSLEGNKI